MDSSTLPVSGSILVTPVLPVIPSQTAARVAVIESASMPSTLFVASTERRINRLTFPDPSRAPRRHPGTATRTGLVAGLYGVGAVLENDRVLRGAGEVGIEFKDAEFFAVSADSAYPDGALSRQRSR